MKKFTKEPPILIHPSNNKLNTLPSTHNMFQPGDIVQNHHDGEYLIHLLILKKPSRRKFG